MKTLQKLASFHANVHSHFNRERYLVDRQTHMFALTAQSFDDMAFGGCGLASLKDTMRVHYNPVLGRANDKEFYNWCLRLLLERATEWCYRKCLADNESVTPAKIMFSERGGHDYHELRAYLTRLEAQTLTRTLVLKKRGLAPGIIFSSHCEVRPHADVAGLQLADIAASAIFQAACSVGNKHCLQPAQNLKPVFPKCARTKRIADFSLLRLPFAHQGTIPLEDRPIFEHFGYKFEKG